MDRRRFSLSMMGAAALAGCGGGGGPNGGAFLPIAGAPPAPAPVDPPAADPGPPPPPPPAGPELATPTALPARTLFHQAITSADPDGNTRSGEPNHPNTWDLYLNFSLTDGGNDQFDGALELRVEYPDDAWAYPMNQTYGELTALGPEMGSEDGVLGVSFTDDPRYSGDHAEGTYAFLHAGPTVRLQQTLNLAGATGGLSLSWAGDASPDGGGEIEMPAQVFEVAVRDTAGGLLASLYRHDGSGTAGTWGLASLSAFAGQSVVLSFEQLALAHGAVIDTVSVKDGSGTEFVTNGDFEAQGSGWTVTAGKVSQNVRAGARQLGPLAVERSFYTQPNQLWARFTDVLRNPGTAPVTATLVYNSDLGSDEAGIVYATPGAADKALTAWDGDGRDRDVGLVFGSVDAVSYRSATVLRGGDGSDDIQVRRSVTVPAGGSVTFINFVILSGTDTGYAATDISARATEVDTLAAEIANHFRTRVTFQRGLTQEQLDGAINL